MKNALLAGLAAGLLAVPAAPPAAAEGFDFHLQGRRCDSDVAGAGGSYAGQVSAGPLLLVDRANPAVPREGRITCTIQVGARTHGGADTLVVPGDATSTVLVLPPSPVAYSAPPEDPEDPSTFRYLCTQVEVTGGPTLYWHAYNNASPNGEWSTSADSACHGGPQTLPCCPIPYEEILWWVLDESFPLVDPLVCSVLAQLYPPEGDIPGLWDCPPYGG